MTPATRAQFEKDGFLVVPNVLSAEQVASLRGELTGIFEEPATYPGDFDKRGRIGSVRSDICSRHQSLRWLLTHPPLLEALRGLLGADFKYLPEMSAHHAGYGDWHKDTTSQERAGEKFHWDDDYLMVEAGLYLQPNTPEYGGGLSVIPGSHNAADTYLDVIDRTVFDKLRTKLKAWNVLPTLQGYAIPSRPGDLVLFHFRIDHRATPCRARSMLPEHEKYSLFFACSRANALADQYVEYIKRRPDYLYMNDEYPADLMRLATEHNLSMPR